ncbi:hypothetical protein [Planctomicrobium piriforme]|nr:hypothetical protein [Planctomicrobium piriforme]
MTRRSMLALTLPAIGWTLTGCQSTTTKVTFTNQTGAAITVKVSATSSGKTYGFSRTLANGKSATQSYTTPIPKGTTVNLTGQITIGSKKLDFSTGAIGVAIGGSNTYVIKALSNNRFQALYYVNGKLKGTINLK